MAGPKGGGGGFKRPENLAHVMMSTEGRASLSGVLREGLCEAPTV